MNMHRTPNLISAILILVLSLAAPAAATQLAERETLPNGMVVLHSGRHSVPMVSVVMAIRAGSIAEPSAKAGLAYLTAALLNEGTQKRTSREISEAIEFVGARSARLPELTIQRFRSPC